MLYNIKNLVFISLLISLVSGNSYSGFFTVDPVNEGKTFYWFWESQTNASTAPVILYLTGGPGASMALSMVYENGPFKVNPDFTTTPNPNSWNTVANVIYVDSPLGTGFSTVNENGYSQSESETSQHLYSFLQQFFNAYPQYRLNSLYIFGESVSSKTAPNLGYLIHQKNKVSPASSKISLRGIGIVSAFIDPVLQLSTFPEKAFYSGFISKSTYKQVEDIAEQCRDAFECGNANDTANYCNGIIGAIGQAAANFNIYDVTKTCPPALAPICYDFSLGAIYFSLPSTRAQLGLPANATWNFINPLVRENLLPQWFVPHTEYIPKLLDNNYKVLVMSGNNDYIGNSIGNDLWVAKLRWSKRTSFNDQPKVAIYNEVGTITAYKQSFSGLTTITVKNAGHFIDNDQPTIEYLKSFISQ
ncbi:peptidase S10 family protein [Tieghemostelium lacteum]|uniref:Peptidase S10 family protein n=1 Tax=Tieghemostelium lacteum TaxID=361077 RepID=A0A151ZSA9_TIELA|nr:peptidase S10 family protein [Tieghemostelium lacteum]|eukprot:KYQ96810.1 peptidase S10 family protein [Tieghemostelium lacteum]